MNDFMLLVGQMSPKTQMPPSLYTSEPAQESGSPAFIMLEKLGTLRRCADTPLQMNGCYWIVWFTSFPGKFGSAVSEA